MRGIILGYDVVRGTGVVTGDDGSRYSFIDTEYRADPTLIRSGVAVDFEPGNGAIACEIYPLPAMAGQPSGASYPAQSAYPGQPYAKSNVAAGLLALFLGPWGIHKFYLGYGAQGAILLIGTLVSFLLAIIVIGVFGLMAISIVCLVEAIIYLTKSPAEFDAMYVQNKRPWF